MLKPDEKVFLLGFMGVGKSTVARHLAGILRCPRIDLDFQIEKKCGRSVADIIKSDGVEAFRRLESELLGEVLTSPQAAVVALGGGAWTVEANRTAIKAASHTSIWLEATFEHCWVNIQSSRRERPLAKDKAAARALFEERQKVYCLADLHFRMRPGLTSFDAAKQIAEEVFGIEGRVKGGR